MFNFDNLYQTVLNFYDFRYLFKCRWWELKMRPLNDDVTMAHCQIRERTWKITLVWTFCVLELTSFRCIAVWWSRRDNVDKRTVRSSTVNCFQSRVSGVLVWMRIFFYTLNSEEWERVLYSKYALLHRLLLFFSSFGQFVNTTLVKIFSFCCESFVEPRTTALLSKCVTHQCKQVVIERNQVWWVSRMG